MMTLTPGGWSISHSPKIPVNVKVQLHPVLILCCLSSSRPHKPLPKDISAKTKQMHSAKLGQLEYNSCSYRVAA
jgi:hypothetical protein